MITPQTGLRVIDGVGRPSDRLAVRLGTVLYRRVFPRVRMRGSSRLGTLPWFRSARAVVDVGGGRLSLPAFDAYWARHFYLGLDYEPEVAVALRRLTHDDTDLFLDLGANYGYWSVRAASGAFGRRLPVIAVEASRATYDHLVENIAGYGEARWSAVSDAPGHVTFDDTSLAAERRISASGGTRVPAVTIDELADHHERVLIKLDVEGAEPAAVAGAARTIARGAAFVYEDHGSDPTCAASAAMLDAGLRLYRVLPDAPPAPLPNLATLARLKTVATLGYNFVAVTPGSPFEDALRRG